MQQIKTCKESTITMHQLILPNDTNFLHNLMGGRLMYWMDEAAAMAAMKHTNKVCVTASVDHISFKKGIALGEVVELEAKVTRVFNTSLEVRILAWSQDFLLNKKNQTHEAFFTFVALDENRNPTTVVTIQPETDEEKQQYDAAQQRRMIRLTLAKQ